MHVRAVRASPPWGTLVRALIGHPPEWHDKAACRRTPDPERWFPPVKTSRADIREVKKVCRSCPVVQDCGQYALDQGYDYPGIWGGMTKRERNALLRRAGVSATYRWNAYREQRSSA